MKAWIPDQRPMGIDKLQGMYFRPMLQVPGSSAVYPEAGCDEAGRGCLAGPVAAAAVIMPEGWNHPVLNDSKQLNRKQRELLRGVIEKEALQWAVVMVEPEPLGAKRRLPSNFMGPENSTDTVA